MEKLINIFKYALYFVVMSKKNRIIYNPFTNNAKKIKKINKLSRELDCIATDCCVRESPDKKYPYCEDVLYLHIWHKKQPDKKEGLKKDV